MCVPDMCIMYIDCMAACVFLASASRKQVTKISVDMRAPLFLHFLARMTLVTLSCQFSILMDI